MPDPAQARQAVQSSLEAWRKSPQLATTSRPTPSVVFVDQQRQPGRPLQAFTVLGDSEIEGCRQFRVKLVLADPEETILVAYNVFGEGPIWVYRSEDFEMIMHWDHVMADESPVPAAPARPAEAGKTESKEDPPGR